MIQRVTDKFRDDQTSGGRMYRNAILNTLIHLRPRVCVEIGTNYGNSSRIFQYYADHYQKDFLLVTADIKKYSDLSDCKNIRQVQVHPHVAPDQVKAWHDVRDHEMLPCVEDSVKANTQIIYDMMLANNEGSADLVFVDGGHLRCEAERDVQIAKNLLKGKDNPQYILYDDVGDYSHESAYYYDEIKEDYNHYEFGDWGERIGMGLVWKK